MAIAKVSILIPYYNDTEHIEAAIQSAYAQTYPNWEVIVVDDCSPKPEAAALIRSLQQKYGFTLLSPARNGGATRALQLAFEHASGDYISILSQDDLYTPDKLAKAMQAITSEALDAVYFNGAIIGDDYPNTPPKPFETIEVEQAQANGGCAAVSSLLASNDTHGCLLTQGAVYSHRLYGELSWVREKFILDDYPMSVIVWRDYKVRFYPDVVYLYRHHDNNIHKQYWRWFPARLQVVAELVEPERRLDTLAFYLMNMGEFSMQNRRHDDAARFIAAGMMLADSSGNQKLAMSLFGKLAGKLSSESSQALNSRMHALLGRHSFRGRLVAAMKRLLIGLVPVRAWRKQLRKKLAV